MKFNKKPKMIFFDVGGTLLDDGPCIPKDGFEALRLASKNPDITTADFLSNCWDEYLEDMKNLHSFSGVNLDIPLSAVIKFATMKSGLDFDISICEQEEIFDRFNSTRTVIDGISELLETLKQHNIRTAVISNNMMSGESLALAIKHWIPNANFEFCLTSADVLYCKPSKHIFKVALGYAHLNPEECWYCGDGYIPDIEGASGCNIAPVHFDKKADIPFEIKTVNGSNYLAINHWNVLTDVINNI